MSDDERMIKIFEVADYIIDNHASFAQAGLACKVSAATVADYINNRLRTYDPIRYKRVREIVEENRPKTILDDAVQERIQEEVRLIKEIKEGKKVAEILGISESQLYRDLRVRLLKLYPEIFEEIDAILKKNSSGNLSRGNPYYDKQKRGSNGRFIGSDETSS